MRYYEPIPMERSSLFHGLCEAVRSSENCPNQPSKLWVGGSSPPGRANDINILTKLAPMLLKGLQPHCNHATRQGNERRRQRWQPPSVGQHDLERPWQIRRLAVCPEQFPRCARFTLPTM